MSGRVWAAVALVGCAAEVPVGPGAAWHIDVGAVACAGPDEGDEVFDDEEPQACVARGFLEDGPYDRARGHGWLGPGEVEALPPWLASVFPLGLGTRQSPFADEGAYGAAVAPHLTSVTGLTGYRVDVPAGSYTVDISFTEPGLPLAGARVVRVSAEGGAPVLVDVGGDAGQGEVVTVSLAADVTDGTLDVAIDAASDPAVVTAIDVWAGAHRPGAVHGLEARAPAGEGLIRWLPEPHTQGYLLARSVDGGAYAAVGRTVATHFVDRGLPPGSRVVWTVRAIGAGGHVSAPVTSPEVVVGDASSLGLPVLDLTVGAADLEALLRAPHESLEVPVSAALGGDVEAGTLKLRGQSTRGMPKRSFTVHLDSGRIDGRKTLKLLAEAYDPSRLQTLLAYDLLQRAGHLASVARPVLLRVNGEVHGVYSDVEAVNDDFLEQRGVGVDDRFRLRHASLDYSLDESGAVDLSGFEKKEHEGTASPELEDLLRWLAEAPEHQLAAELDTWLDAAAFADYIAGQTLIGNWEVWDGGHYLVLDPVDGRFLLLPWDHNNGTFERAELPLLHNTAWATGAPLHHWTRAMGVPWFRAAVTDSLQEALDGPFAPATQRAAIDALVARLQPALAAEPWVFRRWSEATIAAHQAGLHRYTDARAAFIADELGALIALDEDGAALTSVDADGVRITNLGAAAIELEGCRVLAGAADREVAGTLVAGEELDVALVVDAAGGTVELACGGEGDDEGWGGSVRSRAVYPTLEEGQRYVRVGQGWVLSE